MRYDINIYYHPRADKYLRKLNEKERDRIVRLINSRIEGYVGKNDGRYISQSVPFHKIGKFNSTVFFLKINQKERAIISIDEDPIFEKIIVNVFTVCNHETLNMEMKGIVESLYQKMINDDLYDEEEV